MKQRRSIEVCVREAGLAGMRKTSLMCTFICALVLTILSLEYQLLPEGKAVLSFLFQIQIPIVVFYREQVLSNAYSSPLGLP